MRTKLKIYYKEFFIQKLNVILTNEIRYVTDTMYLPSIAKEVQGSDLLFCEGIFAHVYVASYFR